MPPKYIDKTGQIVDLSSFGDAGAQNMQANRMGYSIAPTTATSTAPIIAPGTTTAPIGTIPPPSITKADIPQQITPDQFQVDANPMVKMYQENLARQQATQAQIVEASRITPEMAQIKKQLGDLNLSAEKAIANVEAIGGSTSFAGGETARVQRQAKIQSDALVNQYNALLDGQKTQVDALTSTLKFDQDTLTALSNLSKLTQPDVISTGIDKTTGEVYSISKDPTTGKVTQNVIGKVTPEVAKTTDFTKTYTNAQGQVVAWGQDKAGNIVQKVLGMDQVKTNAFTSGGAGVSQELQDAINNGTIDPNRVNSRTIGLYNDLAKGGVNASSAHADISAKTLAYQDAIRYSALASRTTSVLDANMPLIINLADKVNKTGIPVIDKAGQWIAQTTSNNPDVIKYVNSINTIRAEYANMLAKGTQVTESMRKDAQDAIPIGYSSAGYQSLLTQLNLETSNIISAANNTANMVKPGTGTIGLQNETAKTTTPVDISHINFKF